MSAIKVQQFGGMLPAWDTTLLPNGQAADALNAYLFSGGLTGWRTPKLLHTLLNSAAKFAYRIPVVSKGTASDTLTFISNPNAGDKVTVGEITYTFGTDMTVPYNVLIDIDGPTTAQNFLNALTLDQGKNTTQGVKYGLGTAPNPDVDQFGKCTASGSDVYVQAADVGAAYNTTVASETTGGARLSWATNMFTGGANATFDPNITGSSVWLEFLDPDTNVLRSPVVDDQFNRYYMASPSLPPKYNTYDRIAASQDPWLLGVPPPGCAPIVTVTGGTNSATLGLSTSTSANNFVPGGNTIWLAPVTPTADMAINDCQIMPAGTNATAQFAAFLYSDNAGVPDLLLGQASIVVGCTSGIPIVSTFANPVAMNANQKYWIGFATDTDGVAMKLADDLNNNGGVNQSNTWTNGPPGAFNVGGNIPDLQMWADLTTGSVLEGRSYVYTWVTEYSEESPPSPSTTVNGWSNGVWDVTVWSPSLPNMGVDRNIKTIRLYRTVPGTTGQTVFYWVCDLDIASNTISDITQATGVLGGTVVVIDAGKLQDTLGDDVVALNLQLPSTNWFPPPDGLAGIVAMPNGFFAGFRNNEIWFSEPYHPHAWPPGYVITTEFPIVGLGVSGFSVVACTGGTPYVATGVNPSLMTLAKLQNPDPCISRGGIVSTSTSVFYPSQKGLIEVGTSGTAQNTSESWITREKWAKLTPQKNVRAVLQSSCYFAFGTVNGSDNSVAQVGYTIELNAADAQSFTIWPQPGGHRIGFCRMSAPSGYDMVNLMNDPWTGITMTIQNNGVYYYDFTDEAPLVQPYLWHSKLYQEHRRENHSAIRIFFDIPPNTPAQNAVRNTSAFDDASWNTLQTGQYGIVKVFGDGNLLMARELRTDGELLRISSEQKFEFWEIEISGRVYISNIQMATSVKELRNV